MKLKDTGKLPLNSVLFEETKSYDYIDSFSIPVKRSDIETWELVAAFFQSAPNWVDKLFMLRNKLAGVIGLKVGMADITQLNPPYMKGQRFGVLRIHEITEDEVVLGEDDKHLDFKTSFIIERGAENKLVVSTIVKINNFVGTTYFFVVKRFHRIIVPMMLKKMAKKIDHKLLPQHAKNET